jgi:hypothetical protein
MVVEVTNINPKVGQITPNHSFFFHHFCGVGTLPNHPHEDLAKFGYRTSRIVKTNCNPTAIWQLAGASGLKLVNQVHKSVFSTKQIFKRLY